MKPIEERMAVVETKVDGQEAWLKSIDEKMDQVIAAMNMGRGAWKAMMKIGGLLVLAAGAIAWLVDHIPASWK